MNDLFYVVAFVAALVAIGDIWSTLRGRVEKALWTVAALMLPLFGPALWYYVRYVAPEEKRRRRRVR